MFFKGSRYEKVETDSIVNENGVTVQFKEVRFIPDTPARLGVVVQQGERIDNIADRVYDDPERFWRICDANRALWPADLVSEPGDKIVVPPAEG
jgi:hypothetical protein